MLSGLFALLIKSRPVQVYAVGKLAAYLSREWQVDVRIGAAEINLSGAIRIEKALVGDRANDTLFYLGNFEAQLQNFSRSERKVRFAHTNFANGLINFGIHQGDSGQNLNFLIDYFAPKSPRTGPKAIWTLRSDLIHFDNMTYRNFDDNEAPPEPGFFDPYHLEFNRITGYVDTFMLYDDSLHFGARRLQAWERSGLRIAELSAQCKISYYGMDFNGFRLRTPCSDLGDTLRFRYSGYNAFSDFNERVRLLASIPLSRLCVGDLGIFSQALKNRRDVVKLATEMNGFIHSFGLRRTDLRFSNGARLLADATVSGLPDWRNTFMDVKVERSAMTRSDLIDLLGGIEIPEQLAALGVFGFRGSFTGFYNHFTTSGTINSEAGNLSMRDWSMDYSSGLDSAAYSGYLAAEQFDAGKVLGLVPVVGKVTFNADLRGRGIVSDAFQVDVNAGFPYAEVNGRVLSNLGFNGRVTPNVLNGEASLDDPLLSFTAAGEVNTKGPLPVYRFTDLELRHADLGGLGLDTSGSRLSFDGSTDITFGTGDDINGKISLRNIRWQRLGIKHQIQYLVFDADNSGATRNWTLRSNMADVGITGQFTPANLASGIQGMMHEIMPEWFDAVALPDTALRFDVDFNLRQPALLIGMLQPGAAAGAMHFRGSFDSRGNACSLASLNPTWYAANDLELRNVSVKLHRNAGDSLRVEADAGTLRSSGATVFRNLQLQGVLLGGVSNVRLSLTDSSGGNSIRLHSQIGLSTDSIDIRFRSGQVKWFRESWNLDPISRLQYVRGNLLFSDFYLDGSEHYIEVSGTAGRGDEDFLRIQLGNFAVADLRPFAGNSLDSADASINGQLIVRQALSENPALECDLLITNIRYGRSDFGDLQLLASNLDASGVIGLDAKMVEGPLEGSTLRGFLEESGPQEGPLNLNLDMRLNPGSSVLPLQPFLNGLITLQQGTAGAELKILGNTDRPDVKGTLELRECTFILDYTRVSYTLPAVRARLDRNIINLIPFHIIDETGRGRAIGQASVQHTWFRNFTLDAEIAGASNLKALATSHRDNSLFYGNGFIDGGAKFSGPIDYLDMVFNLKSRRNTLVSIPISDVSETGPVSYVRFKKKNQEDNEEDEPKKPRASFRSITVNLEMTPEAEVRLIFDQKLGDIMKGSGNGDLRMLLDENGNFSLYGQFTVASGEYLFTALDLINKKFYVNKGGTITWNGDPYDAILNMEAEYRQKLSPAPLMAGRNVGQTVSYPVLDVASKLFLTGRLFSPDIRFDLEFPNLQTATSGTNLSDLNGVLQRIRSDKDEVARQVFGLLVLGNFIPPAFAQQAAVGASAGAEAANNTVSGLLSNQLNNWLSQFGGRIRLTLNMETIAQAAQNLNRVSVNVKVPLFNDRLMIDGTVDPTQPIPNVNVEYSITQDGKFRVKAYSRNANLLYQAPGSSTNLSTNTMGLGLFYRREFDRWGRQRESKSQNTAPR